MKKKYRVLCESKPIGGGVDQRRIFGKSISNKNINYDD